MPTDTVTVRLPDPPEPGDLALFEEYDRRGWGDGLPVIAPTRSRVAALCATVPGNPGDVVAVLPPAEVPATTELIAVNAVMAGCAPEHFPVVLAAVKAMAQPRYSLLGQNTSTNPSSPMLIVNGSIRGELKLNQAWGVFGPCFRANAVIGRAVNLTMINIAGRVPGQASRGTYKHPGAFTMCAAEDEENNPWEPLHVSRGLAADSDAVTVLGAAGLSDLIEPIAQEPEELAICLANMMVAQVGSNWLRYRLGEIGLMLCPPHAAMLARGFPRRVDLQTFLREQCLVPHALISAQRARYMEEIGQYESTTKGVYVSSRPDQWLIFVAGGPGGLHSCHIHTYGAAYAVSEVITRSDRSA